MKNYALPLVIKLYTFVVSANLRCNVEVFIRAGEKPAPENALEVCPEGKESVLSLSGLFSRTVYFNA